MGFFSKPKPQPVPVYTPPPAPAVVQQEPDTTIADQQAEADLAAQEEADELRRGRVKTILTSGQGLDDEDDKTKQRKTVLGG